MFDVFYSGTKPNLYSHEQLAETIEQAQQKCRTRYFWWVNYLSDYSQFDFLWEPVPWESDQMHVWPSQHQENGGTMLVPRAPYTNVNRNHAMISRSKSVPVIGIDHGTGLTIKTDRNTRYINDYLGTLRRILSKDNHEYVWVVTDVCDYTNFDFTWHPSEWQTDMLHVFASDDQKFGDTFYVHVPSFLKKSENIKLLEWFDTINFVDITVPRKPMPVIHHNYDSQAEAVGALPFDGPLALYTTTDYVPGNLVTVPLWRTETKTVVPLSAGATSVIVPKSAVGDIRTQLYDYPFIDRTHRVLKEQPLDIVFISNGEPNARSNYLQMTMYLANESMNTNRVHLVEGVNGRVAAYHAAARASTTPWFFAVFAKLEVNARFDWSWQPDRMQQAKHYIFHAGNPVNGLVYGHQAMIAYNKKLALENTGVGLDFTLDQAHEVVPILSGTAMYAETPWMAWRTAFREALKLRASLPDVENEYRLKVWLKEDSGTIANGHWSHKGAQDAVEFYEQVNGDLNELRKSYEWAWLASYAFVKRSLTTNQ
jgi:hypothetical protein